MIPSSGLHGHPHKLYTHKVQYNFKIDKKPFCNKQKIQERTKLRMLPYSVAEHRVSQNELGIHHSIHFCQTTGPSQSIPRGVHENSNGVYKIQRKITWAGEKGLPCKCKNLSLITRTHAKMPGIAVCLVTSALGRLKRPLELTQKPV